MMVAEIFKTFRSAGCLKPASEDTDTPPQASTSATKIRLLRKIIHEVTRNDTKGKHELVGPSCPSRLRVFLRVISCDFVDKIFLLKEKGDRESFDSRSPFSFSPTVALVLELFGRVGRVNDDVVGAQRRRGRTL